MYIFTGCCLCMACFKKILSKKDTVLGLKLQCIVLLLCMTTYICELIKKLTIQHMKLWFLSTSCILLCLKAIKLLASFCYLNWIFPSLWTNKFQILIFFYKNCLGHRVLKKRIWKTHLTQTTNVNRCCSQPEIAHAS